MKQYASFKQKYPGTILLFRVGDFYETFGEDAIKTADILGIILTKRANGAASHIELAGFPYHSLDTYLPKLVRAGQRVAICEQLEDPKLAKGIVKRGVTELITPGITLNDKILEQNPYNFLAAVWYPESFQAGLALLDLSTGDFFCCTCDFNRLEKILFSLKPAEIVLPKRDYRTFQQSFGETFYTFRLEDYLFDPTFATNKILQQFQIHSLKGFGLEDEKSGVVAAGVLLHYLSENEQRQIGHLTSLYLFQDENYVSLDKFTIRNLEILNPLYPDGKSLLMVFDETKTPMGARLLRQWLVFPLQKISDIEKRLACVESLVQNTNIRLELQNQLKLIGDLERSAARLAAFKLNPRESCMLRNALSRIQPIYELLASKPEFSPWLSMKQDISQPLQLLQKHLLEECPPN
ncbi:MAG: DNA mismatch repair protein MutS, partial [Bacteroidia bacterium]|nr:DNA mismatch repair protein MutS [Bacteroidia bacterium]